MGDMEDMLGDDIQNVLTGPQSSELPTGAPTTATPPDSIAQRSVVSTAGDPGMELPGSLRGRYLEDPFFARILQAPSEHPHFQYIDGLLYKKHAGTHLLCVPDIFLGSRRVREILIRHAHSILAHLGKRKTVDYLREEVWWPELVADVSAYCQTCGVCATTKSATSRPLGLLRPLPVPRRPWQYIGIDFVGPLPASSNRHGQFDMICVIICQLTSMVHLVPTMQTYGATEIAEVVFEHVYKLHGLPERIISDRDTLFTSTFWRRLHELLGTELRLSSSYHPQTDGATERANRTMTQMLRQCVQPDQKDWVQRLPAIELAMNTARSDTTGFSPFYLNYGQMPRSLVWNSDTSYPGVRAFAQRMKDAIMAAHDAIISTRVGQVLRANKHRRPASFKEGDLVYLSTKNLNLPKGRARKLVPKYLGPFAITKVLTEGATYRLDLPKELLARGLNNAFHASLLRPHFPNDDRRFPGRQYHQLPGFGEQPQEWAVERIISHVGRGRDAEFEVQWSTGDVTWVPYHDVRHLQALTEYYEALGVTHARQLTDVANGEPDTSPAPAMNAAAATVISVASVTVTGSRLTPRPSTLGTASNLQNNSISTGTSSDCTLQDNPALSDLPGSHIMSAVPGHYNLEDRTRWEQYAAAVRAYGSGLGPHPGDPPPGYVEVFRLSQRYAPVPADYARPAVVQPHPFGPDVTMSAQAFNSLLTHNSNLSCQIALMANHGQATTQAAPPPPWRPQPQHPGRGRGQGRPRGGHRFAPQRRGTPLADRLDARPENQSGSRGRGRRTHRGRSRGHRAGRDRDEHRTAGPSDAPAGPSTGEFGVQDFLTTLISRMADLFYADSGAAEHREVPRSERDVSLDRDHPPEDSSMQVDAQGAAAQPEEHPGFVNMVL